MSNLFVTSDTHFFHSNILTFEPSRAALWNSVEEMNEGLVDRWNATVSRQDTVYHLGDVLFGGRKNFHILDRLNGNKKLVLGNHDTEDIKLYLEKFRDVYAMKLVDGHLLTHIPIASGSMSRYKGNVHGHLHSRRVMFQVEDGEYIIDPGYLCASVEQTDFKPLAWEEVKELFDEH